MVCECIKFRIPAYVSTSYRSDTRPYQRLGYRERGPFGAYLPNPLSVFMEKRLAPPDATPPTVGRRKEGHPEGKRA